MRPTQEKKDLKADFIPIRILFFFFLSHDVGKLDELQPSNLLTCHIVLQISYNSSGDCGLVWQICLVKCLSGSLIQLSSQPEHMECSHTTELIHSL